MAERKLYKDESRPLYNDVQIPIIDKSAPKYYKRPSLDLPSVSSQNFDERRKKNTSCSQGCSPRNENDCLAGYHLGRDDFAVNYQPLKGCGDIGSDLKQKHDLTAMSILSLYKSAQDIEENDMDTSRDFIINESVADEKKEKKPKVTISSNKTETILVEDINDIDEYDGSSMKNKKDMPSTATMTKTPLDVNCLKPTIFFNDNKRSVDFVLVWDGNSSQAISNEAKTKRYNFELNLKKEGLQLEYEEGTEYNNLQFVKIHAPLEVLKCYSEILKLKMPMRKIPGIHIPTGRSNVLIEGVNSLWERIMTYIRVDESVFPKRSHRFTAVYSRDKEYLFDLHSPCFFTPSIHSRIVKFILDRKRFSNDINDDFAFGIERLINDEVYIAAYPLHDGDLKKPGSMRNLLYTEWAAVRKWYRYQPLDHIKEYFGVKIALYFAWLGFYTHMLVTASVVGILCFIYSACTIYSNRPSEDVCNENLDIKMCPICDYWCDYWDLKDTCLHARVTYLFDNPTTVFFAIFMSFWATLFLEMWKRYSAEITYRWDLTGFDAQEGQPRPHYLARLAHVKRKHMNIVTNTMEPLVPFWRLKLPVTVFSVSVIFLLVILAFATVLAVILYRISVLTALTWYGETVDTSYALFFTSTTAAIINLICITIFNLIYSYVAEYLTELELLRTQTEFDNSLTLKIYLLQFVNYYASIFYIAFIKGKFIGYPGNYTRFLNNRQEECSPGGCLLELCIQLAIIMIGKQTVNAVFEMLFPLFMKWVNAVKSGLGRGQSSTRIQPQWVKDYTLNEWGSRSLFPEYLEMVLQYGFVTIFVAAFPLAPFFALINNIFETRLDATKLLTFFRRPVSQRVTDIGVWYVILNAIGKLAVITNGLIIAFTSEFIPRLVYKLAVSPNNNLEGYLNYSLSYFNTSDFQIASIPNNPSVPVEICRYPDFREPPNSDFAYKRTTLYWHILAARLAFILLFENLVAIVMIFVRWCIPDVSSELRDKIRREAYITNEIIIKQETLRATEGKDVCACPTDEQWEHLVNKSLTGSEFDLVVNEDDNKLKNHKKSEHKEPPVTSV